MGLFHTVFIYTLAILLPYFSTHFISPTDPIHIHSSGREKGMDFATPSLGLVFFFPSSLLLPYKTRKPHNPHKGETNLYIRYRGGKEKNKNKKTGKKRW